VADSITFENVGKEYAGGNVALTDVSLEVEPGEFVVLLGPSGSGKTTLLRCLAGIERLTSGRIAIGGTTVASDQVHITPDRRNLSMVFQDYALWPHLRVRENVAFALRRARLSKPEARARTQAMLERVGLGKLTERFPNELSGGEQQRVALARALVGDTGIILYDEPLSNLDADLRERMRVEISALVREAGVTAVYITHDQAEAFALADKVGVLEQGRLVQYGTPEAVYNQPATPFVARFTGLAGELAVRVRDFVPDRGDGSAEVELDGPALRRPCRARASGSVAGEATLLVRPSGVRIADSGDDDHHLAGVVADVAFRGRGYEHAIDIPGHGRLTGVFAPVRASRGETVSLLLDPDSCHAFAAATDPGEVPAEGARPAATAAASGS
jgi:iron(III) transport system ATP-binding protein